MNKLELTNKINGMKKELKEFAEMVQKPIAMSDPDLACNIDGELDTALHMVNCLMEEYFYDVTDDYEITDEYKVNSIYSWIIAAKRNIKELTGPILLRKEAQDCDNSAYVIDYDKEYKMLLLQEEGDFDFSPYPEDKDEEDLQMLKEIGYLDNTDHVGKIVTGSYDQALVELALTSPYVSVEGRREIESIFDAAKK